MLAGLLLLASPSQGLAYGGATRWKRNAGSLPSAPQSGTQQTWPHTPTRAGVNTAARPPVRMASPLHVRLTACRPHLADSSARPNCQRRAWPRRCSLAMPACAVRGKGRRGSLRHAVLRCRWLVWEDWACGAAWADALPVLHARRPAPRRRRLARPTSLARHTRWFAPHAMRPARPWREAPRLVAPRFPRLLYPLSRDRVVACLQCNPLPRPRCIRRPGHVPPHGSEKIEHESRRLVNQLLRLRAPRAPAALGGVAKQGCLRRWWSLLSVALQRSSERRMVMAPCLAPNHC